DAKECQHTARPSSSLLWRSEASVEPPEGPGFEPLISKALECDSFEGKGTPEGIFRLGLKRHGVASHARGSSAGGGRRLTDGITQQSRRARPLPCRIYRYVRAWETPRSWGPSVGDSKIYRIQCGRFRPWLWM